VLLELPVLEAVNQIGARAWRHFLVGFGEALRFIMSRLGAVAADLACASACASASFASASFAAASATMASFAISLVADLRHVRRASSLVTELAFVSVAAASLALPVAAAATARADCISLVVAP